MKLEVSLPRVFQIGAILSAFGLWLAHGHIDAGKTVLLSGSAILLFGLPHGAFDRIVTQGPLLKDVDSLRRNFWFLAFYLGIAGCTVALWLHVPALCLGAFLAISAVHFGCTDLGKGPPALRALFGALHGSAPIILIPYFHKVETTAIFDYLSNAPFAAATVDFISLSGPFWAGGAVLFLAWNLLISANRAASLELIAVATLLALMPPLPGFLLYFGGLHSPKHLTEILAELRSRSVSIQPALREAAIISAVALGGFAVAFFWVDPATLSDDAYRVLFIGLAALTIPHMTLVDGRRIQRSFSSSRTGPPNEPRSHANDR